MRCERCGIEFIESTCPNCASKNQKLHRTKAPPSSDKKKPIFKRWWFWVILFVVVLMVYAVVKPDNSISEKPKSDANEIVDSANSITVGDLQKIAAGGLLCIEIQYGMNNAESIDSIMYNITPDGNCLTVITCASSSGKVAFYAADTKSEFTKLFPGGYRSYNPYIYYGLYDGNTLLAEPKYAKRGELAIEPVVSYAHEKWGF